MPRVPRPRRERPRKALERPDRAARDYERRQQRHAEAGERIRAFRDEAIQRAYREGLPTRDIVALVGLSQQHVSRIVRRF